LVATTLGLPNRNDFLNGTALHFSGASAAGINVQNGASLNALGHVFLIANTVQNSGTLSAGNEAGLAAGTTVTLAQSGSERLTVVAGTQTQTPFGVNNTEAGKINAVVTELKAAGGNIYALAINNAGIIRATSLVKQNGHVYFRATDSTGNQGAVISTGTINVDQGNVKAADITVQGSQVNLGGTVNAGAGTLTVTTTSAGGANGTGNIAVNDETKITAGSLSLHSGTDGTGDILFGGGVKIQADTQSYQAGIGNGSLATASADLADNNPTFLNQAGTGSPTYFTFEQDATILDSDIPASCQFFNNTPPANYTIQSDGGNLTLDTGADVAGSALTLDAAGALTMGGNLNLNSLAAFGNSIALNGGTVTTVGAQTYNQNVTLGAATTLSSSSGGNITFAKTVDGAQSLTVNTSGNEIFNGAVGGGTALTSLTTDGSGTVGGSAQLNGGSVTTTGGQTYNDNVTLGANTTLNGTTLNVNGALTGSGNSLTLNNSGTATLGGTLSGVNALAATGSGNLVANNTISSGSLNDGETTALNGGTVTTVGAQTYNQKVTLGAATTLTGSGGGNITFAKTVDGAQSLVVNTAGTTTFGGTVGNNQPLTSLTTDAAGTTSLNGGVVNANTTDFKDDVTLGVDTILNGTTANFEKTVNSPTSALLVRPTEASLTVNASGVTTFGGAVGNNQGLASLTTDAAGTTTLNGGTVSARSADFNDDVILGANTTLSVTTLSFEKTVNSDLAANNRTLTIQPYSAPFAATTTIFGGAVGDNQALGSLAILTPIGTTAINGGTVTTTGSQTYSYNNNVTLGENTTLNGTTLNFSGTVSGGGNNLMLNNSGAATLGGALSGVNTLTASGSGNLVANNAISAGSLNDSETTALNGGTVTTVGAQAYNQNVTLAAATTLSSSGGANITFAKTIDGAQSLAVNTSGNEIFNGAVGSSTPLTSLTTDGSGTVGGSAQLNGGSVTTIGSQTYNDNITLGANTVLNGTSIGLLGTMTGGGNNLTLNNSDAATLSGTLSGVNTLTASGSGNLVANKTISSGSLNDSEATTLNGGTVTTSGAQIYNQNVTLGAPTTLSSSGGANITFAKTIDGAQSLAVNTSGNEIFNGAVGSSTPLTSLTTDGSGTVGGSAQLNGGSVTTTGGQTYNDNITLGANTTLNGTTLNLNGALAGGGNSLTLNNSETATLQAVSGVNALVASGTGNLVADGAISVATIYDLEPTLLNGSSVAATGKQTYGNIVTLGANTTLNLSGLTFTGIGAISGNGHPLIVNGVVYSVVGEDETLKRNLLGAILPTYHPIEVRARKPWQRKRTGLPPWSITDPMNSLQVPFD
jgi:hypothetical protein